MSASWSNDGKLISRGSDLFDYDALGRLSNAKIYGVNGESVNQAFGYDELGNRISVASTALTGFLPAEATSYELNIGQDNRLPATTIAGVATGVSYDALGRMSQIWAIPGDSSTLTSWTYDAAGRVISQGGAQVGYSETYLLDSAGLRFKRVKPNGAIQYRVYGFDREPLSTFEKPATANGTYALKAGSGSALATKRATNGSAGAMAVEPPPRELVKIAIRSILSLYLKRTSQLVLVKWWPLLLREMVSNSIGHSVTVSNLRGRRNSRPGDRGDWPAGGLPWQLVCW